MSRRGPSEHSVIDLCSSSDDEVQVAQPPAVAPAVSVATTAARAAVPLGSFTQAPNQTSAISAPSGAAHGLATNNKADCGMNTETDAVVQELVNRVLSGSVVGQANDASESTAQAANDIRSIATAFRKGGKRKVTFTAPSLDITRDSQDIVARLEACLERVECEAAKLVSAMPTAAEHLKQEGVASAPNVELLEEVKALRSQLKSVESSMETARSSAQEAEKIASMMKKVGTPVPADVFHGSGAAVLDATVHGWRAELQKYQAQCSEQDAILKLERVDSFQALLELRQSKAEATEREVQLLGRACDTQRNLINAELQSINEKRRARQAQLAFVTNGASMTTGSQQFSAANLQQELDDLKRVEATAMEMSNTLNSALSGSGAPRGGATASADAPFTPEKRWSTQATRASTQTVLTPIAGGRPTSLGTPAARLTVGSAALTEKHRTEVNQLKQQVENQRSQLYKSLEECAALKKQLQVVMANNSMGKNNDLGIIAAMKRDRNRQEQTQRRLWQSMSKVLSGWHIDSPALDRIGAHQQDGDQEVVITLKEAVDDETAITINVTLTVASDGTVVAAREESTPVPTEDQQAMTTTTLTGKLLKSKYVADLKRQQAATIANSAVTPKLTPMGSVNVPTAAPSETTTAPPLSEKPLPPSAAPPKGDQHQQPVPAAVEVEDSSPKDTKPPSFKFGVESNSEKPAKAEEKQPSPRKSFTFGKKDDQKLNYVFGSAKKEDKPKPVESQSFSQSTPAEKKPAFSFSKPAETKNSAEQSKTFAFGQSKPDEKPSFSFSKPAVEENNTTDKPKGFSFKKPTTDAGKPTEQADTSKTFAFGQSKPDEKKPTFSFAKPAENTTQPAATTTDKPGFTFGSKTPDAQKKPFSFSKPAATESATNKPAFSFGGKTAAPEQPPSTATKVATKSKLPTFRPPTNYASQSPATKGSDESTKRKRDAEDVGEGPKAPSQENVSDEDEDVEEFEELSDEEMGDEGDDEELDEDEEEYEELSDEEEEEEEEVKAF